MINQLRILFVEDTENDALLMTHHLKNLCQNIHYMRVETKKELQSILEKEEYDIIIIDNALPQLTAFEAIQVIKEMNIEIPMICVSGSEMLDVEDKCLAEGAKAFIIKSDREKLVKTVEKILKESFDK
ncbi:MAG: response regulator [Asgard group archaeon]|nr:response regulator [Asgard group archaeon]